MHRLHDDASQISPIHNNVKSEFQFDILIPFDHFRVMTNDLPVRHQRGRRSASENVRKLLVEAAGKIFAAKGFDRATAKEIAAEAGTNAAAINYHFAGIENLYEQVLAEAHHRLLSYDALRTAVDLAQTPEGKLRAFLDAALATISMPENEGWPLRVFTREIVSPTSFSHVLLTSEISLSNRSSTKYSQRSWPSVPMIRS